LVSEVVKSPSDPHQTSRKLSAKSLERYRCRLKAVVSIKAAAIVSAIIRINNFPGSSLSTAWLHH